MLQSQPKVDTTNMRRFSQQTPGGFENLRGWEHYSTFITLVLSETPFSLMASIEK